MLSESGVPLWQPIGKQIKLFSQQLYASKPVYGPVAHIGIVSCFAAPSALLQISSMVYDFQCQWLQSLGFLGAPLCLWESCQVAQGDP